MTDDQREQELASITPEQVTDFVARIAFWRASEVRPGDVIAHNYPIADGRILGLAKRTFDVMAMWVSTDKAADRMRALSDLLAGKLKSASVDKEAGRVEFLFTGEEMIALRPAVLLLEQYDLTKQRDAREASRPQYPKRKR